MHLLAAADFVAPHIDYFAFAPEIVLTVALVLVLLVDLMVDETHKYRVTQVAGLGVLAALVPVVLLAVNGVDRSMFGGAYVVGNFALVFKGLFLVATYVVLLMATNMLDEGDYYEGEFSFLLLSSALGMLVMASARDLITIFVALELLSIPAYMLAGWKKRDLKSNEAALKYYLLGVLASGIMLYGMSLIYGATGTTLLSHIGYALTTGSAPHPLVAVGILFIVVGFAFKVSAVPFHAWAPDTYEGAPLPVTAFLSVASKAAGFVALIQLVYVGFFNQSDIWQPMFWVLAVATMTVGNLIALRQTNIVRMLAYSSIAQAGYMLVPLAVAHDAPRESLTAMVVYLLVYTAMNLGIFATVMAVSRKTQSGEISSFAGLFEYAPGLTMLMTIFLFSLAGIPPLGGWFAKFTIFNSALSAGTPEAVVLAVIVGVNSVIALYYYGSVAKEMWMSPVPNDDRTPIVIPPSLFTALGLTAVVTVAIGVMPQTFARLGDLAAMAR